MARPLLSRKLDLLYLLFFIIHIPIILLNDLALLYPLHLTPQPLLDLRSWYVANYKDRFFVEGGAPAWFRVFLALEGVYHLPLSAWALGALVRDDIKISQQLLLFAAETAITTLTCLAEVLSWKELTLAEKGNLAGMYGGYLVLAVFMGVDMYARLDALVARAVKAGQRGKKEL